ncbi:MAG: PolC-type DNA polymerase III N-terminal domain-containing protein [Oscillospiraceae bacterium]
MQAFKDIFAKQVNNHISALILDATIEALDIDKQNSALIVTLNPNEIIPKKDILLCELQLKEKLQLETIIISTKYSKELFVPSYVDEILYKLKRSGYMVNGFFDGAEYNVEDNILDITLKLGGLETIKQSGTDKAIEKAILKEFGISFQTKFGGILEIEKDSPEYNEIMSIPTPSTPKKENVANIAKTLAPINSQKEQRSYKPPSLSDIKNTNSYNNLPFMEGTQRVVIGKAIKTSITPLSEVNQETGTVTVWGDVFSSEIRETRDKKHIICSFELTDYTG